MQNIIIAKPYQFVPAHRGNWMPGMVQSLRIVDLYLARKEGIASYEVRGIEHLRESLRQRHGVLLAPNHCRYSDPLALGWVARHAKTHLFAMASWHLFHQSRFQSFAMRMCGAFSVYREGVDRQSLDTAIDILVQAVRPLVVFPEGAVFRTNDVLQPLLDGVAFLARSAARRRSKLDGGKTVIHPVGIKYVFRGDVVPRLIPVIEQMESRFTWQSTTDRLDSDGSPGGILRRVERLDEALLSLKEIQFLGKAQPGEMGLRRRQLINHLLESVEACWLGSAQRGELIPRIKQLRMKLVPQLLAPGSSPSQLSQIWSELEKLYVAQQVGSYPTGYLDELTDMRLLETIERIEEDITDRTTVHRPLHAILQVDEAIEIAPEKPARDAPDPVMATLQNRIETLLGQLKQEARPLSIAR